MASNDDDVEITGVREDPRKSAEYHRQRADAAIVVKREARKEAEEARADEAEAERDVERVYTVQEGERHRYEYLVRLVEQSIKEQRVISQDELEHVTKMSWRDAAAANAAGAGVAAAPPAAAKAAAAASPPQHTALPVAPSASAEVTEPALLPAKPVKPPTRAIQKLVDANKAAINPPGTELLPAALQAGTLVWGYFKSDRVWYPGAVRGLNGQRSVLFDDGDVDDDLDDMHDPRPWRLRADEGSGSSSKSQQMEPEREPKRRRLAKESAPALAPAPAPSEEAAMPARAAVPQLAPSVDAVGSWEVQLAGKFQPFEDQAVQEKLEEAYDAQIGPTVRFGPVDIIVRNQSYQVVWNGSSSTGYEQVLASDTTRRRAVRRVPLIGRMSAGGRAPPPIAAASTSSAAVPLAAAPAAAPAPASAAPAGARAQWWDNPDRFKCNDKIWPKRIPNFDVEPRIEPVFNELIKSGACPIVSYMIWDICHKDNTVYDVNRSFVNLCNDFNVFELGFSALCDKGRDETVVWAGKPRLYPQHKQSPPPEGSGYHSTRGGEPRKYAKSVVKCVKAGGNGGVVSNQVQDFVENIRDHPLNKEGKYGGRIDLSFIFEKPAEMQKRLLHDLTVIKDVDSKTVKHGVDMIHHLVAAKGSWHRALESYLVETLKEEIKMKNKDGTDKFSKGEIDEKAQLLDAVESACAGPGAGT